MANFDDESKRMAGAQADIAEMMAQMMKMRSALTTPTVGEGNMMQGPMVEALQAALGNQQQRAGMGRQRLQATPFNPFGGMPPPSIYAPQTFGPSMSQLAPPTPLAGPPPG